MSDVHVVTSGVVFHSPAVSPANANAQPIVASAYAGKTSSVKGQVVGTSVVIANPA